MKLVGRKSRVIFAVVPLILGLGCQVKDENMARRSSAGEAKAEKAQVYGVNYLGWVGAYLVDVQNILEAGLEKDNFSASAAAMGDCGQITLDQIQGGKREIFLTHNECRPNGEESPFFLSGEMLVQVYYSADGKTPLRIQGATEGPFIVSGAMKKDRSGAFKYVETRNFGATPIDPADSNGPWQFRMTVTGSWSQEYSPSDFVAREEGKHTVKLAGKFAFVNGQPKFLAVDEVWWSGQSPRQVNQKGRRASKAANEYQQRVEFLLLRHVDKETEQSTVLTYGGDCGWPAGALDVGAYSSSFGDEDKITSKGEKRVLFTAAGIEIPARGVHSDWPGCDWQVATHRSLSRVGVRTPYLELFLR